MNVMIYNKYKDLLLGLNIDVMKSLEGVYNVDEIIDTFTNFYYDKMILDITAIDGNNDIRNYQALVEGLDTDKLIWTHFTKTEQSWWGGRSEEPSRLVSGPWKLHTV